jgi:hypothetical protein
MVGRRPISERPAHIETRPRLATGKAIR